MWCGVVWCGVVWCGAAWCGVVWCGVVWCGVVWVVGAVWCGVVLRGVVGCGVVWCGVTLLYLLHPAPAQLRAAPAPALPEPQSQPPVGWRWGLPTAPTVTTVYCTVPTVPYCTVPTVYLTTSCSCTAAWAVKTGLPRQLAQLLGSSSSPALIAHMWW